MCMNMYMSIFAIDYKYTNNERFICFLNANYKLQTDICNWLQISDCDRAILKCTTTTTTSKISQFELFEVVVVELETGWGRIQTF
jgi:hypothetical protein